MKTPWIIASLAVFAGCVSRSGPFVTNISTGGPHKLNVEKCYVEYDSFNDRMQSSGCVIQTLDLLSQGATMVPKSNSPAIAPTALAPAAQHDNRAGLNLKAARDPESCADQGGKWMRSRCYQD